MNGMLKVLRFVHMSRIEVFLGDPGVQNRSKDDECFLFSYWCDWVALSMIRSKIFFDTGCFWSQVHPKHPIALNNFYFENTRTLACLKSLSSHSAAPTSGHCGKYVLPH